MGDPVSRMNFANVRHRLHTIVPPILFIVVAIIAWEIVVRALDIRPIFLPAPSFVIEEAIGTRSKLLSETLATFNEAIAGFAISIVTAVLVAVMFIYSQFLRRGLLPLFILIESTPQVAFAPLLLVWFGYGFLPKMFVALLVCFFPIVVDTTAGLNAVEPELLDLSRILQASNLKILLKIRLPNSIPYFFNGLKTASALSVVGALVAEFVATDSGLGLLLLGAQLRFDMAMIIICIFILGLIGIGLYTVTLLAERVAMPWRRQR